MSTKDFKTIDEQLEILRSRGLIIDDENIAKDFLLYNNYYRISGYSLTLRKNNIFSKSASFQNIIDIYNFDHELRRYPSIPGNNRSTYEIYICLRIHKNSRSNRLSQCCFLY